MTEAWLSALLDRHTRSLTRAELLKAIRALSARYVERRRELPDRSPLDTAGKRAAFAAFYAPLHFLTAREIVRRLGAAIQVDEIADLGCGTGVAGAAWALECAPRPVLHGIDRHAWALGEARWTWRALGLDGHVTRGDFVRTLDHLAARPAGVRRGSTPRRAALMLGWSLNELAPQRRAHAIEAVLAIARSGAPILVIEPIATRLVPWWPDFAARATAAGGRTDEWRLDIPLPPPLADLDEAAGFERERLTARTVAFGASIPPWPR